MILVTAYENPDLDGFACAFAYSEYLVKKGKNVVAGVFGKPHREALFVIKKFSISKLENAEKFVDKVSGIVLVDASDVGGLSSKVNPNNVVEIIDHRKINEVQKFPNAKAQIELVGAAATLIAERFYKNKIPISKESAALLFSAIISNTINFHANVTTKRDKKMATWLKSKIRLPKGYVHEMFTHKSEIGSIREAFISDFATFDFGKTIGIAQLEIVGVDEFVVKNLNEIRKTLNSFKKSKSLDFVFLTCVDLEKAFNKFVVIDNETEALLVKSLKTKFKDNIAKRNGILMRKEIVPLIKEVLKAT